MSKIPNIKTTLFNINSNERKRFDSEDEPIQTDNDLHYDLGGVYFPKSKPKPPPRVSVSVSDDVINDSLVRMETGENEALKKLLLNIGGQSNLSSFKLSSGINLVEFTIEHQLPNAANALFLAGFDINAKKTCGMTCSILTLLCRQTYHPRLPLLQRLAWIPIAKWLVQKGVDISSSYAYDSPLIEAVDCSEAELRCAAGSIYYELLSIMLEKGANVNMIVVIRQGTQWTQVRSPLLSAVMNHNPILAQFLLEHHANKNVAIDNGNKYNTPLSLATYYATSPSLPPDIRSAWQPVYQVLKNAP